MHQGLGTRPLSLGYHAQGFQGGGRFEVSKFKLNLAMAVAEVSEDRVLLANLGNEAELVIDPVASVESVVHDVFSKYRRP